MRTTVTDLETRSECGIIAERAGERVRLSLFVQDNGDLDVSMSLSDFRNLVSALTEIAGGA